MSAPIRPGPVPAPSPWPRRLAWLTAGTTCLLILVGGLVTNTGSGLAVPDWPTTFGYNMFLYPWSRMVGGVLYEHSHRLIGSAVGLFTVALAASLCVWERRPWLRTLGVVAVLAVAIQGVLGGLRVVLVAQVLAMIHGAMAPAFLALVVSIALFTSPAWTGRPALEPGSLRLMRPLALGTTLALYLQIVLGVILTHTGRRLDAHLFVAAVVSLLVPMLARRILAGPAPSLGRPARILLGLWAAQLLLGLGAYLARFHGAAVGVGPIPGLALPLAHRLTGALLVAGSLAVTLQIFRVSAPARASESAPLAGRVPA